MGDHPIHIAVRGGNGPPSQFAHEATQACRGTRRERGRLYRPLRILLRYTALHAALPRWQTGMVIARCIVSG